MTLRQLIATGLVLASSVATPRSRQRLTGGETQVDVQAGVGKTARGCLLQGAGQWEPRHVRGDGEGALRAGAAGPADARRSQADGRAHSRRLRAADAREDREAHGRPGDAQRARRDRYAGHHRGHARGAAGRAHHARGHRGRRCRPPRGCAATARRARDDDASRTGARARRLSCAAGGRPTRSAASCSSPESGEPVYEKAFGLADREHKTRQQRRHPLQHRLDQQDLHEDRRRTARVAGQAEALRHARRVVAGLPQRRDEVGDRGPTALAPGRRRGFLWPRLRHRRRRISSGRMPTTIGWSLPSRRCLRQARGASTATGATSCWARSSRR